MIFLTFFFSHGDLAAARYMRTFIHGVNCFISIYSERVMARQMINWPGLWSVCMNKIQLLPCLVYVGHFIITDKVYVEK